MASFWGVKYDRDLDWRLLKVCLLHGIGLIIEKPVQKNVKRHDGDCPRDREMIVISLAELKPQGYHGLTAVSAKGHTTECHNVRMKRLYCRRIVCVSVCVCVRERARECKRERN